MYYVEHLDRNDDSTYIQEKKKTFNILSPLARYDLG